MVTTVSTAKDIVADILADVAARESRLPFVDIKALSRAVPAARPVIPVLSQPGCSVIAEIKRAKPAAWYEPAARYEPAPRYGEVSEALIDFGAIDSLADVASLAQGFESAGVAAIACQTERLRFRGSLEDMATARSATSAPMLCRDIIVDPYQVHEARFFGADMVPLQVELLEQPRLEALVDRIESLGMTALAEIRSEEQAQRAMAAGVSVVGINARELDSRSLQPDRFAAIVPHLPDSVIRIGLGGIMGVREIWRYAGWGADAVLVGEALMAAPQPADVARALVAAGVHPACPMRRL